MLHVAPRCWKRDGDFFLRGRDRTRTHRCSRDISRHESALSAGDLGHEQTWYAAKAGEEYAQNTPRNTTLWRLRTADSVPPLSAVSLPDSAHS
jgi:hypothetical protein